MLCRCTRIWRYIGQIHACRFNECKGTSLWTAYACKELMQGACIERFNGRQSRGICMLMMVIHVFEDSWIKLMMDHALDGSCIDHVFTPCVHTMMTIQLDVHTQESTQAPCSHQVWSFMKLHLIKPLMVKQHELKAPLKELAESSHACMKNIYPSTSMHIHEANHSPPIRPNMDKNIIGHFSRSFMF